MSILTEINTTLPVAATTLTFAPVVQQNKKHEAEPAIAVVRPKKVSEGEAEKIVRDINSTLQTMHTEVNFSVDKETDKMVLKIVNSKTQEVIRQIPAEDALRIASRISKLLGVLFDENA